MTRPTNICLSEILALFGVISLEANRVRLERDGERFGELTYEVTADPDLEGYYFVLGPNMGPVSGETCGPHLSATPVLLEALERVGWMDLLRDAGEHREDHGASLGVG